MLRLPRVGGSTVLLIAAAVVESVLTLSAWVSG